MTGKLPVLFSRIVYENVDRAANCYNVVGSGAFWTATPCVTLWLLVGHA